MIMSQLLEIPNLKGKVLNHITIIQFGENYNNIFKYLHSDKDRKYFLIFLQNLLSNRNFLVFFAPYSKPLVNKVIDFIRNKILMPPCLGILENISTCQSLHKTFSNFNLLQILTKKNRKLIHLPKIQKFFRNLTFTPSVHHSILKSDVFNILEAQNI